MIMTGHTAYKKSAATSIVNKEELLLRLYAGALDFLGLARRAMAEKNLRVKGENISKVLKIITELDCALDRKNGGEIAENLSTLYRYVLFTLVNANKENDIDALDTVEDILKELQTAFQSAALENAKLTPHVEKKLTNAKGSMQVAI